MKKFLLLAAPIILMALGVLLLSNLPLASAQVLVNTNQPGGLEDLTNITAKNANFGTVSVGQVVATTIRAVLSFLGIVFIILMIVAGWRWMTAQGNEEAVTQSKDSIRTAIIGLIIVLAAYAITYFVFKYLPFGGASQPPVV
jgi:hypothetical protein